MLDFTMGFLMAFLIFAPVRIVFGTFVIFREGKWVFKWERFDD